MLIFPAPGRTSILCHLIVDLLPMAWNVQALLQNSFDAKYL